MLDTDVPILKAFDSEDIELRLPSDVKASEIKWISLFCRDFDIDFGHVIVDDSGDVPKRS